jgi:peptidoglycan L-alanyl-D-glutamate endopeptidase CwlK
VTAPRYAWGARSLSRLQTCHPLLVTLFERVIARADLALDLSVLCGHRTNEEQAELYAKGRTAPGKVITHKRPGESKHNRQPSHAVDVAPYVGGSVSWAWPHYHAVAPVIRAEWAAMQAEGIVPAGVTLTWGGDWQTFPDGPHWELSGVVDAEGAADPLPLAAARAGAR